MKLNWKHSYFIHCHLPRETIRHERNERLFQLCTPTKDLQVLEVFTQREKLVDMDQGCVVNSIRNGSCSIRAFESSVEVKLGTLCILNQTFSFYCPKFLAYFPIWGLFWKIWRITFSKTRKLWKNQLSPTWSLLI